MSILIDKIRIKNFRALKDIEVNLKPITILVGANNAGKTTFLRALNSVLGISRNQINQDDLFIDKDGKQASKEIIIDIRIVPIDENGNRINDFDNKWASKLGGTDKTFDTTGEFFAFRSIYNFGIEDTPSIIYKQFSDWENEQLSENDFKTINQIRNNVKMYFIDAQRDILEDSKQRTSFFGKLVSNLDYGENIENLKSQIENLNKSAIENSEVLKHLKEELKQLNQTTQTKGEGVTLNPFPKKISDLHKGMKVYFQDNNSDAFSMENHGMGTRSWASIITAGAFTSWQTKQIDEKIERGEETDLLFPIFALEEPEAHLHPNAQRTLYKQLKEFKGQKIVSTHSPYIAGQADLEELRHFYKDGDASVVSEILFDYDDRKKIKEFERNIEVEGKTPEAYKKFKITELKTTANQKLSESDKKDLVREIFLNKGELLYSKALLLFEGPTEEIALPIFYEKYFGRKPFEDGITFVGVGGKKNYSPFLKFAKFLKIPIFILSDGDDNTEVEVKNQIKSVYSQINEIPLFILPNNSDFEKFLLESGYESEINEAIDFVNSESNYIESYIQKLNGQKKKGGGIRNYTSINGRKDAILDCMGENKTEFAYDIAIKIIESEKKLPPILNELFDKIAESLNLKPNSNE
jgi:putative ATP-dependent endonuclease of OLD family